MSLLQLPARQSDGSSSPSLYSWAAGVHSRVSGSLEDFEGLVHVELPATSSRSNCAHTACPVCADEAHSGRLPQSETQAIIASSSGRKTAHQLALEHQQDVAMIHELLKKDGLHKLPQRLDSNHAELIRSACNWDSSMVKTCNADCNDLQIRNCRWCIQSRLRARKVLGTIVPTSALQFNTCKRVVAQT